jgi:hypothetical protein
LEADSKATVEIGITNTTFAIARSVGYTTPLTFHQFKMSKSGITDSFK